jgi:HlyD family secretion protein
MELSPNGAAAPQPALQPVVVPPRIPESRRSFTWLWIAAAIAVAAAAYFGYERENTKAASDIAAAVPTIAVSAGEVRSTIRVNGTVEAEKSVTLLAPRIQGSRSDFNRGGGGPGGGGPGGGGGLDFNLVLLHLKPPGMTVKAGDVVAEFDTTNQMQRLDDYRDAVVQQEGTIRKMEADLAAAREARVQAVRAAKATWDQSVLDMKVGPVKSDIDAEKDRLTVEENALTYKEQVAEMTAFEESQKAGLRSAQFSLDQARSELQRAQHNIEKMTIRAPIDGMTVLANVVLNNETRQVREGDQIFAGQPFLSIVDPRSMILKASVNQVDAERLRLGMKASVGLDAYPEFRGTATVEGIGAMAVASTFRANFVGEIPVRLKIDARDTRLIPDLTGSAEVTLATENDAPIAPRAAIFADAGHSFVYLKTPEGWRRQDVELGISSFTDVAVKAGVHSGDVLALRRL